MNESFFAYVTAAIMIATFAVQVVARKFDPFAPIWLFFVGYGQLYVIQPLSYHDWAVQIRGADLLASANFRASWALAWFLAVYLVGPGRLLSAALPRPPARWSVGLLQVLCPLLFVWGLFCAGLVLRGSGDPNEVRSAEMSLFLSFPAVMVVSGALLIVTGRDASNPRPAYTAAGVAIVAAYLCIWMFNGKRSHSLIAVLVGVCSFYLPRLKRPSFAVLGLTAVAGAMAVGVSIGWRFYANQNQAHGSLSKFVDFVSTFDPSTVLASVNVGEDDTSRSSYVSHETEEIGGLLLMMDTVPEKSDYDYGVNYLRVFSTFIPRIVWPDKPLFGRDKWIAAWIAGSELKRDETFTGPAIGILGACHLNGGAWGTFVVMGCAGLLLRTTYEYFRRNAAVPWVQAWWALTYYNAWMMTAGDDPLTWFYYNYGLTTMPPLLFVYLFNRSGPRPDRDPWAA